MLNLLTFVENFEDYISDIGLQNEFGLIFLGIMLILGVTLSLIFLKAPTLLALVIGVAMILMFAVWGWFPVWLVILIAIIIFVLILFTIKGGL